MLIMLTNAYCTTCTKIQCSNCRSAIITVRDQFQYRSSSEKPSVQLTKVAETHRTFPNPIIFWDGIAGYHSSVKMINP